jgi:peptidyl-prolyl cis-trans isomerase B (cyclophilin B)
MGRSLFVLVTLGLVFGAGCGDSSGGDKGKNPVVVMKTSMGTIKVELFQDKAPKTVENFLKYADDKFYDGTVFHRVMSDFMIQGGGFAKGVQDVRSSEEMLKKEKKTRDPIKNEADNKLSNKRGTLAMARTGNPHSASAQFFINVDDNARLDHKDKTVRGYGYCVFGKVVEGMDVVDKIKEVKTRTIMPRDEDRYPPFGNVPVKDVVIVSVRRADK